MSVPFESVFSVSILHYFNLDSTMDIIVLRLCHSHGVAVGRVVGRGDDGYETIHGSRETKGRDLDSNQ